MSPSASAAASAAADAAAAAVSRSAYVSRLRRAFLLRAHPDRFRSQSDEIRKNQADLVYAISERLSSPDFLAYTCAGGTGWDQMGFERGKHPSTSSTKAGGMARPTDAAAQGKFNYILERNDGALIRKQMDLDDTVVNVLQSMADALESTGAAAMPSPPPPPSTFSSSSPVKSQPPPNMDWMMGGTGGAGGRGASRAARAEYQRMHGILWAAASSTNDPSNRKGEGGWPAKGQNLDHRFDINTHRGRDLKLFLRHLDKTEIETRKSRRMDATAAALVARRAYGFAAIDGTGMGWSSTSLAMILSSLTALHDEHGDKLHVTSFYPLRLIISSDEFEEKIDLYGGTIRLNPAATPLQWLETLMAVTDRTLDVHRSNQHKLRVWSQHVQRALGVKMIKGHTCSSRHYHDLMERLSMALLARETEDSFSTALTLETMTVTVESKDACRRGTITREGNIRVGAGMSGEDILSTISKLGDEARRRVIQEREVQDQCGETVRRARGEFGLHRVYRAGLSTVSREQFLACLLRLLTVEQSEREGMKVQLAGNSLGIAGSGHFCHLGDDGSIVIPVDWR